MIQGGDCDGRLGGEEELFVIRQLSHLDSLSLKSCLPLVCLFSGGPGCGAPLGGWGHNGPYPTPLMSSGCPHIQFIFTASVLFCPAGGRNPTRGHSDSQILTLFKPHSTTPHVFIWQERRMLLAISVTGLKANITPTVQLQYWFTKFSTASFHNLLTIFGSLLQFFNLINQNEGWC